MGQKTKRILIWIDPETHEALSRAAIDRDRPMTVQARRILLQWLRSEGYLTPPDDTPTKTRSGS